jgi:hypothetical protein
LITSLFISLMILSCGTAFWRGRSDERMAATAIIFAALLSPVAKASGFSSPETGILGIDMALLVFLFVLALRSDRFWPLWAAGFQVVGTTIHLATFVEVDIWPPAYMAAQSFWAYPVLTALLAGTWLEARFRTR